MNKLAITIIIFLSFLSFGQSQTMQAWIDEGEKAFTEGDYYGAYKCYEIALRYKAARLEKYDSIRTSMLYKYAESARLAQIYYKADETYQQVLQSAHASEYPLTRFWLGKVAHISGDTVGYERARDYFQSFLNQAETVSDDYVEEAEKGFEDALWAMDVLGQKDEETVVANMGLRVNSKFSDYGTAFKGDTLYYSSYRFLNKKDSLVPPRYYMRIMESVQGDAGKELPPTINRPGRHVAHTAFNTDASMVYFTICDFVKKDTIQCKLHRAVVRPDGSWEEITELTHINAKNATNTHPNIGMDFEKGQEVLFFTSDRQGGQGGMDIWYSYIDADNGNLAAPKNLIEINTEWDDATPFYHSESQSLFFSTDGYQTLGGMDVYKTRKRSGDWSTPEHLGMPINSSYNDLYYTQRREATGPVAYFSSNRPSSDAIFWDKSNDYCCNDIYRMRLPSIDLLARTFNLRDSSELTGATVILYEEDPSGELIEIDRITINPEHEFHFDIERGKDYVLKASKDGFGSATVKVDPDQYPTAKTIEKDLFLDPSIDLIVNTWHSLDTTPLTDVMVTLYEVAADGSYVAVDSMPSANTNRASFNIDRNKKYIVTGAKPGFMGVDTTFIDPSQPQYADAKQMTADLYLGQMLEVNTFEAGTLQPLAGVRVELYDLSEGEPKLIHNDINMLGNNFKYPLHLDRPYMIRAIKDEYDTVEDVLTFRPEDAIAGNGRLIFDVYLPKPFELVLYFDNDHPNPRTRLRRTSLAYIETNRRYYEQKDLFINGFTEGMSKNDSFVVSRQFNDFFERDVNRAPDRLIQFSDRLIKELSNGEQITVQLMGSASPKGATGYNDDLAARRIDCVKNEFMRYKNAEGQMLRPYIYSGQLKFIENNFGESNYDPDKLRKIEGEEKVSDSDENRKASVYDLVASARRHVRVRLVNADALTNPSQQEETRPNTRDRDQK